MIRSDARDRPRPISVVLLGAALALVVAALLIMRDRSMPPQTVVRSPYLRPDLALLNANALRLGIIAALDGYNVTGTVEREEIVLLTVGQWLTLNEPDLTGAPPLPRWTPLYVLTQYGQFETRADIESVATPAVAILIVVAADTGTPLDVRRYASPEDILHVDAEVKDSGVLNPALPTPPRDVAPGSA